MNERIKELVKKAGFSDDFIDDPELASAQQKFAKLIVRECSGLLVKEAVTNHDVGDQVYNQLMIEADWLKKHFGIGE